MSLPSSLRYKARKREKAREAARKEEYRRKLEIESQSKEPEIVNPKGAVVIDPASDYIANAKGAIVENPIESYVANPSDQLGKGLPPMEQEDYNILMKRMGDAVNSTAVQSKEINMPMYDAEAKDYTSPEEITSRGAESLPASDDSMGNDL